MALKKSFNMFLDRANNIHLNIYTYNKASFISYKIKTEIICKQHGVFLKTPDLHINQKQGCPKCSKKYKRTTMDFIKESNIVHLYKYNYEYSEYNANNKYVKIECKLHGIFKQYPKAHLIGQGCPQCKTSSGERKIEKYLKLNKIKYIMQYKFNDCKNIKTNRFLIFDFYLPDYNILIEFDGIQHYEAVDYFGGVKTFEVTIVRDLIKNEYCNKKKVKLIRIKYDEKDQEWQKKLEVNVKRN